MAQPFDRGCQVPAPGTPDPSLGEFWVGNPWFIPLQHNLSAFERNRTYMNVGGTNFVDVSFLTAADSDGDGRAAVSVDLNGDGRLDLVLRQAGGGPLTVYENQFPQQHWLQVRLQDQTANPRAVGARVTVEIGDRRITRHLFSVNSYMSQTPYDVHFGLADRDRVDALVVQWPDGTIQRLENVVADRQILIQRGQADAKTILRGQVY